MILATASQILGSKTRVEAGDPRIEMSRLLYIRISGGFGLVLNLSEGGMAIQTMIGLKVGQRLKFVLPLSEAEGELTGTAEVAWCDCSGRAGLHFTDVSEREQLQLRKWLGHDVDHDFPRGLCKATLKGLGSSRSSALLNAEVNCLEFLADREAITAR
jgi:PilZ domain